VRPNRDSQNDRGKGMIRDMPLLYMKKSASFWIERNDQEEECLKSLLKHAQLQNMTTLPNEKSDDAKIKKFVFFTSSMTTSCIIIA